MSARSGSKSRWDNLDVPVLDCGAGGAVVPDSSSPLVPTALDSTALRLGGKDTY